MFKQKISKVMGLLLVVALFLMACGKKEGASSTKKDSSSNSSQEASVVNFQEEYIVYDDGSIVTLDKDSGKVEKELTQPGELVTYDLTSQDIVFVTKDGTIYGDGLGFTNPNKEDRAFKIATNIDLDDLKEIQNGFIGTAAYLTKSGDLYVYDYDWDNVNVLPRAMQSDIHDPQFVKIASDVKEFSLEHYTIYYLKNDDTFYQYNSEKDENDQPIGEVKIVENVEKMKRFKYVFTQTVGIRKDKTAFIVGGSNTDDHYVYDVPGEFDDFGSLTQDKESKDMNVPTLIAKDEKYILLGDFSDQQIPSFLKKVDAFSREEDGKEKTHYALYTLDTKALEKLTDANGVAGFIDVNIDMSRFHFMDEDHVGYQFDFKTNKVEKVGPLTSKNVYDLIKMIYLDKN